MRTDNRGSGDYDPDTSTTTDNDLIKVSPVAGTWYRFVWDVACRHEGLRAETQLLSRSVIGGWCLHAVRCATRSPRNGRLLAVILT